MAYSENFDKELEKVVGDAGEEASRRNVKKKRVKELMETIIIFLKLKEGKGWVDVS